MCKLALRRVLKLSGVTLGEEKIEKEVTMKVKVRGIELNLCQR